MSSIKIQTITDSTNNLFTVFARMKGGKTAKIGQFNNIMSAKNLAELRIEKINRWGNITGIIDLLIEGKTKNSK